MQFSVTNQSAQDLRKMQCGIDMPALKISQGYIPSLSAEWILNKILILFPPLVEGNKNWRCSWYTNGKEGKVWGNISRETCASLTLRGKDSRGTPVTPDSWVVQPLAPHLNFIRRSRKHTVHQQEWSRDNLSSLCHVMWKQQSIKLVRSVCQNWEEASLSKSQRSRTSQTSGHIIEIGIIDQMKKIDK